MGTEIGIRNPCCQGEERQQQHHKPPQPNDRPVALQNPIINNFGDDKRLYKFHEQFNQH